MPTPTTFNVNGQPFCTVEISPLGKDILERASVNLRKEHGRKFIPGEMDFDELAEFNAECVRLVTDSLTMADGTRPLLGKPPEAARKFFRERRHEKLVGGIAKLAKQLDEQTKDEFEVTSGN
jgi:hypothetical protein